MITPKGNIETEIIVNCGGLWAREVGCLSNIILPVQPMEHHYLITESINKIKQLNKRLPSGIDYEANIYFRQEQDGMLLGTYEPKATPWQVDKTPMSFGHELLQPDLDRISDRIEMSFDRIPALRHVGIKDIINGPFTFGPDGNPMIGPVPGKKNYWVAVGVMAGFCQGGGVGLTMAEWMIDGEPSIDVWAMDVARFGEYATPSWGTKKSSENYERRFVMTFPNETLPKGRKQKTTSLYDRLLAKGAIMDQSFGLEHALWFANNSSDAFEEPTFRRSRAFKYVKAEVKAVRENVGCIEIANFSKHSFTGPDARNFLNFTLAGTIPKKGYMNIAPMLTAKGNLYGDFTVACLDTESFMLFGSGAMQNAHRRWFDFLLEKQRYALSYKNVSDNWHGLAIAGPKSRQLLQSITRHDIALDGMQFREIVETTVGDVPVILNRLSFTGELGYEVYCKPAYLLHLYEQIMENGAPLALKWYGARAQSSMRLEKGWGIWGLDFRPDYTPLESGFEKFIDWEKDFIGKERVEKELAKDDLSKVFVSMVINGNDIDVSGDEAILKSGETIGNVTSGGYAHYVKKSVALGYIPPKYAIDGETVNIEILGKMFEAIVVKKPLYDPAGHKMRS